MTTAAEKLAQLDKEAAALAAEAARVTALTTLFPDLKIHTDRWKTQRYSSASVNGRVTDYEVRRTCGCCIDAPRVAWPYIETEHGRVYSDPPSFYLSRFDDIGNNEELASDFEAGARKAGLPAAMIERAVNFYSRLKEANEDDGAD